jgi:RNA methyltransferase, TrmH family
MISKNQIKQIQALHQKKYRDQQGRFLVEGIKTVKELLKANSFKVHELFATSDFIDENKNELSKAGIAAVEVSERELEQISTLATPNKVLAICRYKEAAAVVYDFNACFSLYLDDIRDPGNLGTILRIADWYGMETIFCSPSSCDIYNPKVIQSTMGAFLRVNLVYAQLEKVITENKIARVYGAVLDGKNIYTEKLENGLVIVGNEANGIGNENRKLITHPVTIPAHTQGGSESLNAAIATGIISSEFFRQLNFK